MTPPAHFVCVGAQKAGTQWLYDQAASHPDMWMPPIKEVRFFSGKWHRSRALAHRKINTLMKARWLGVEVDPRDLEFLRRVRFSTTPGTVADIDTYRWMFDVAGDSLTGDISPSYARLALPDVRVLVDSLPDSRFLYLVREPVSRLWSAACMAVYWEACPPEVVSDVDALSEFLGRPSVMELSVQSGTVERWAEGAGERFAVFRMSDMIATPGHFRRQVFEHLGVNGDLCTIAADHNKKSGRPKPVLTDELRTRIVEFLGDEPERLENALAAHGAPDRGIG